MSAPTIAWRAGAAFAAWLVPAAAAAQAFEITPCVGYRFGGDFFEIAAARPVDRDGALSLGVLVNVPLRDGLQVEGFFTHQAANVPAAQSIARPAATWRVAVEHFQGGGLQEFGAGNVRPFLTGTLGLSRYAAGGDNEIRFTVAAGGGVKLRTSRRVGVRFDARVFTTFIDVDGRAVACTTGVCFFDVSTDVVWQAEFTTGLVFTVR